jgi:hypothetical protein
MWPGGEPVKRPSAGSGVAMITTISTPRTGLVNAWKIIAAITSPNASSTAL